MGIKMEKDDQECTVDTDQIPAMEAAGWKRPGAKKTRRKAKASDFEEPAAPTPPEETS